MEVAAKKTTRTDRAKATKEKKMRDLDRCKLFLIRVVGPMYAHIIHSDREEAKNTFVPAMAITQKQVYQEYGKAAEDCFVLLFRLIHRGGIDRNGKGFKSKWIPNPAALEPYILWSRYAEEDELTCQHLLKVLQESETTRMVRYQGAWFDYADKQALTAERRAAEKVLRDYQRTNEPDHDTATYF